jgi:hypothetical protein
MLTSQSVKVRQIEGCTEPSGYWLQSRSLRWGHTWSHHVVAICIRESTSAVARSCITRDSHTACTEGRWKKFLSLVSPAATLSGDPMRCRTSILER